MIRYRDGKIVSTKGERFTQVTKAESEEMKKAYVNIPNYDYGYIWQWLDYCNIFFFQSFIMVFVIAKTIETVAVISRIAYHISLLTSLYFMFRELSAISAKHLSSSFCKILKHQVLWQQVNYIYCLLILKRRDVKKET